MNSAQLRSPAEHVGNWEQVNSILDVLGPEGMSTDESDGNGGPPYTRKESTWRAYPLNRLLRALDTHTDHMHANGKYLPGNKPRVRLEPSLEAPAGDSFPPSNLPSNLIDPGFLAHLPHGARARMIKARRTEIPIPELIRRLVNYLFIREVSVFTIF